VLELLGPNIGDLLEYSGGKFSLKTTLMLADQMIARLEHIHSKGYIHRDLKPENLAIGVGTRSNVVYLFDFGLAKCYKDKDTGAHIQYFDNKPFLGTARFASTNAHLGIELSRRDDIESLGYVLIYMSRGNLPWQNLGKGNSDGKYEKILQCKLNTSIEQLCKGLPCTFL
jgi:serine/threonine protein kinase